jgi:hypothetical protein
MVQIAGTPPPGEAATRRHARACPEHLLPWRNEGPARGRMPHGRPSGAAQRNPESRDVTTAAGMRGRLPQTILTGGPKAARIAGVSRLA